ncbi:MAG: SCO1664 family protein [Acidimicrobiales bacterium]|nr:SCO1664 family protein [Acidimicrobiales bacterium]
MSELSPFREREPIGTERAVALLTRGELDLLGRMPYSSNATFLVDVCHEGLEAQAIYKPHRGERPLWDFPSGLYQREVAAFLVSDDLGWDLVPPTVVRDDAPHGTGSLQLFMPAHFEEHYYTIRETTDAHDEAFQRICALDIVINNTDRKSGHCLLGTDERIWAIDHGVAFHHQFKLRTVIWEFAGDPLPDALQEDLWRFLERGLPPGVVALLDPLERDAVLTRATALATAGRFPDDDSGGHRYPWPLV